ncbi:MAG: hypothetical protein UT94_C0057G0001, partial [Candidatus Uhrbacteria bacterium GW2011_GWF2_40_263]
YLIIQAIILSMEQMVEEALVSMQVEIEVDL